MAGIVQMLHGHYSR